MYRFIPKTVALNINNNSKGNTAIHIYPNPAKNSFKIIAPSSPEPVHIELTDITGKIVLSEISDNTNGVIIVETKELTLGTYILSVRNNSINHTETLSIR